MPVLGTKLHVPSPRRELIRRTRPTNDLRSGTGRLPRLVLVAAPAGFGKTTLLAQRLGTPTTDGPDRSAAWLSLDPADADLWRFLTHLVAAIQVANPDVGVEAPAMVDTDRDVPVGDVVASIVNDLDAFAGPTVIALDDDYHVIDSGEVHEAVAMLVDNLPPQVNLAITTRADPPLPLSRLRARGDLLELRAADLRFTRHPSSGRTVTGPGIAIFAILDAMSSRGDILERVMTEVGISQSELSRISGVHQPSISQFLSGRTDLSDDMLDRLLECMGYRLEVIRRPVRPDLTRSERRSWLLHRQLSSHLSPESLVESMPRIQSNLDRLRSGVVGQPHTRNIERWRDLVDRGDVPGLRRVLTGLDHDSIEMREVSPLGGLLGQDERNRVMASL